MHGFLAGLSPLFLIAPLATVAIGQQEPPEVPARILQRDLDGDGREENVMVFADENGRISRAIADSDNDGLADLWATYGPDGEVELAIDHDGDQLADEWRFERGRILEWVARDTDADGAPDVWSVLDENGRVIEVRSDTDGSGEPDVWTQVDPDSGIRRVAYDTDGNGTPDRWVNYSPDGSIDSIEIDTDGDGTADRVIESGG